MLNASLHPAGVNCNTVKNYKLMLYYEKSINCSIRMFQLYACACVHAYRDPSLKELSWRISYFLTSRCECVRVLWNPVRLKRRRQLKQSQSEKNANEQNPAIISCPDIPNDGEPNKKPDLPRITSKPPAGSGKTRRYWNVH